MNMKKQFKTLSLALTVALGLSVGTCYGAFVVKPNLTKEELQRVIIQVDYHLKEFEKEVAQQRGGDKTIYRSKKEALDRVQALKKAYPDDPDVDVLFQRAKVALMKSKGDYTQIDPSWVQYKLNEKNLQERIAKLGDEQWEKILTSNTKDQKVIGKEFPTPSFNDVPLDEIKDSYIVLNDVLYPNNQFYGGTGEFIWHGKPSSGFYFVQLDGRNWLGPYEAIKRYRRSANTALAEVTKYTILGKIVDITSEIPDASENKKGRFEKGWVVEPIAVKVPGHVVAFYDKNADNSGYFVGEDEVKKIKDSWYTVKSIPNDVTPERLMEIFMTAIKEKNYELYLDCINPERKETPTAQSLIKYHWDLHQERFMREYVHATFGEAKVSVSKGFDENNEQENFFLDDEQKDILRKTQGEMVQRASVESKAFDQNGKQVGSPHAHSLVKHGSGRWYVDEYSIRF